MKRDYGIELSPKHDGYKRGLASMMYKFIDKKIGAGTKAKLKSYTNDRSKKFKKRKVYLRFKINIWSADLADIRSLSSTNRSVKCLFCVIDVFTKYTWVKTLKD